MILQDPPPDPQQVADDVQRIMSRDEFRYEPSWWDRVVDWIGEQLDRLFPDASGGADVGGGASFAGGIGQVLAWVLIVAAVVGVLVIVVYAVRNRVRRSPEDDGPATEIEVEHRRSASAWEADAARLEAEGRWKDALRARYRQLVRTLVDRRQVPDIAGRTTGELRDDVAASTPDAAEAFDTASLLFELAWYAHVPTGAEENERFRRAAADVLAATRRRPVDGVADSGSSIEVRA